MSDYNYEQDYLECKAELEREEQRVKECQDEITRLQRGWNNESLRVDGLLEEIERLRIENSRQREELNGCSREGLVINRRTLTEFCIRHNYFHHAGSTAYESMFRAAEAGAGIRSLASMIYVASYSGDADGARAFRDKIAEELRTELAGDWHPESPSYGNHPELVDKIVEVSAWSPGITTEVTRENCVLLESSEKDGNCNWVAFQANGIGFTIDFENHFAGRSTNYDSENYQS